MSVAALQRWSIEQALPLWGSIGFDAREGQFVEQIAFDATPLLDTPRRVMVQARQIYAFGLAHERGWFADGGRIAEIAYRELVVRYGEGSGSRGWAFSADRSGRIVDATRDLYGHAFVLLALASIRRLGGDREPLRLARETLSFLDRAMAAPVGGYIEAASGPTVTRRQNPHMHLFEALLAWHELAPYEGFDARAAAIVELLARRFVIHRGDAAALIEDFDATLAPLGGPDYAFEPGHHFEWVWLLAEYSRLTGRDTTNLAQALWASAMRHGFRADGAILDKVSITGRTVDGGVRLWPLTEALKACRSCHPAPADATVREPDQLSETLLAIFLRPARPGLWHDHFDADGNPRRAHAPASSLYHLSCALAQL